MYYFIIRQESKHKVLVLQFFKSTVESVTQLARLYFPECGFPSIHADNWMLSR